MGFLDFFRLLAGLLLFLYGISLLGGGLEEALGEGTRGLLRRLTGSPLRGVVLGAAVTAAIQSSSAATVLVVELVETGALTLRQAAGVIMGANIGTTATAHLLRLEGGLPGPPALLSPRVFAPAAALLGLALLVPAGRRKALRGAGQLLLGFGLLFLGMRGMEAAAAPLARSPALPALFLRMQSPLRGLLAGAGVTAVIQSSSASVGILQALSSTGAVTWGAAVPILLGQNIGTCVTPLLAGLGASAAGRRAALLHLLLNLAGAGVFLLGLALLPPPPFWGEPIGKGGIAWFHTFFNVTVTALFLPFTGRLERLVCRLIPERRPEPLPRVSR